jgi:hypothetical protein
MAYESDRQKVAKLMAALSLKDLTNEQIRTWAEQAVDIPTAQDKFEAIGKELRDVEQVIEKILNRLAE